MIEILDELTEIPFEVFWDKFQSLDPYRWDRTRAEAVWFSMKEKERILAFKHLCLCGTIKSPHYHLKSFRK